MVCRNTWPQKELGPTPRLTPIGRQFNKEARSWQQEEGWVTILGFGRESTSCQAPSQKVVLSEGGVSCEAPRPECK